MRIVDHINERRRSIPLTVVDGLHGSGKSAIVRFAMQSANERRVAAIVRDLEPLIAEAPDVRREGQVAIWPNGSMSIATDDPTATLAVLSRRDEPPDHVLLEADGIANSRRLGGYGYMPGYCPDGLITVVDTTNALAAERDPKVAETWTASLRLADLVILNKADLAGREITQSVQRNIETFAPQARFVWCAGGRLALPLLAGVPFLQSPEDRMVMAEWNPEYPARPREAHSLIGEHCRCWCLIGSEPIDSRTFRRWVNRMPPFVLRGAGSVYIEQEPKYKHEFSLIGMRWVLKRGAPWGSEAPSTRITLAGTDGSRGESARLIRRATPQLEMAAPGIAQ
jgi:G3E family GTPase